MAKKPNILFFGIDSLRRDRMSLYGYKKLTTPYIDKFLSEDSIVWDNMFSPSIPTTPGYSCMLTGQDCFGTDVVALRHKAHNNQVAPGGLKILIGGFHLLQRPTVVPVAAGELLGGIVGIGIQTDFHASALQFLENQVGHVIGGVGGLGL